MSLPYSCYMFTCYERNKQIDHFHPFHPFQITPLETEYPTQDDIDIGGPDHEAFAWMSPFKGLYNIHGLSTHYTDYYYTYSDRTYTSCTSSAECSSQWLWCDVNEGTCVSKVRLGGVCTGLTDEACYGDTVTCQNDICLDTVV